ncbi:hypothetical protein LguiA_026695 [Lonicera macranthoides]
MCQMMLYYDYVRLILWGGQARSSSYDYGSAQLRYLLGAVSPIVIIIIMIRFSLDNLSV